VGGQAAGQAGSGVDAIQEGHVVQGILGICQLSCQAGAGAVQQQVGWGGVRGVSGGVSQVQCMNHCQLHGVQHVDIV
jgi:hypothetical protein